MVKTLSSIPVEHQYYDRKLDRIVSEKLIGDNLIRFLYSPLRENAPFIFNQTTKKYFTKWLSRYFYDLNIAFSNRNSLLNACVDFEECVQKKDFYRSPRDVFMRQIKYWSARPINDDANEIVSPADSRVLVGSFEKDSMLYIKNKFFELSELLGVDKHKWQERFAGGDFAIFRLTPEKYRYTHSPVSGTIDDIYSVDGRYYSCNPTATVALVTPLSKNKRYVTLINTDVESGTNVGLVAMIEIVALMIGDLVNCYSDFEYENPRKLTINDNIVKGRPKSVFKPGSSTVVLLFEKNKIKFSSDIIENMFRSNASSRYSTGFLKPLLETDVLVRSPIGHKREG